MEMHPYCPSCGCQFEFFEFELLFDAVFLEPELLFDVVFPVFELLSEELFLVLELLLEVLPDLVLPELLPLVLLSELLPVVLLLSELEPEVLFEFVESEESLLLELELEFLFDLVELEESRLLELEFDFLFVVLELDEFRLLVLFLLELPPQAVIDSAIVPTIARISPFFKNPFFFLSFVTFVVCIVLSSLSLIRISKASPFLLLFSDVFAFDGSYYQPCTLIISERILNKSKTMQTVDHDRRAPDPPDGGKMQARSIPLLRTAVSSSCRKNTHPAHLILLYSNPLRVLQKDPSRIGSQPSP